MFLSTLKISGGLLTSANDPSLALSPKQPPNLRSSNTAMFLSTLKTKGGLLTSTDDRPIAESHEQPAGLFVSVATQTDFEVRDVLCQRSDAQTQTAGDWDNRKAEDDGEALDTESTTSMLGPIVAREAKSAIAIRPALHIDVPQIKAIYDSIVRDQAVTPEVKPKQYSNEKFHDQLSYLNDDTRLPFLVAVDRSAKGMRRMKAKVGNTRHRRGVEPIVGFAWAEDHVSQYSLFRFSVEVEVFVRQDFVRRDVASCLLDRLMVIINPSHAPRMKVRYDDLGQLNYQIGGARTIKTILVQVFWTEEETRDWKAKWLSQFNFEQCGEIKNLGFKPDPHRRGGTPVNVTLFVQHSPSPFPEVAQVFNA